jgi:hypothetical protein
MFRLIVVAILLLGTSAFASGTSKKPCTETEAVQADKVVDSLTDWDRVYRAYKKFSQCDDGAIAEGYSDAVGKLLANDWTNFDRLRTLANTNRGFLRFVLKHIDATLPDDILQKISTNARSACPAGGQNLCRMVASASAKATAQGSELH